MDTFRHAMAVVLVCMVPGLVLYWLVIHGFIRFWRRLGPQRTLVIAWLGIALLACGMFLLRDRLIVADWGTNWALVVVGFVCIGVAGRVRLLLHRHITNRLLLGVPELAPDGGGQTLVREGLYARVRHPRYVQMILALLGWALIANFPAAYAAWLFWVAGVCVIVPLEERELRARFGADYDDYMREVPRFIPRRKR